MPNIVQDVQDALAAGGLLAALRALNQRAPHRFTGLYRYDGETLRNVALFDRWHPDAERGADAPMAETFCSLVPSQGLALEVVDGTTDKRFPWMRENEVVCYCGALLRDEAGTPWGTVCHFDLQPCEAARSILPDMLAVSALVYKAAALQRP